MTTQTEVTASWTSPSTGLMDILSSVHLGRLTTAHAASSRGLPVWVSDDDGRAYGPSEIGALHLHGVSHVNDDTGETITDRLTVRQLATVSGARAAGYVVHT